MDIEKLNKSQIVLLTLLVSFMTSMTTGIVTVSLMEGAPPVITETVNRVVERTVERVVSGQAASVAAAEAPAKTVVVRESDLIPQALQVAAPSIVRIYTNASDTPAFLGLGVVIDASGVIAIDAEVLGDSMDAAVELPGSMRVPAKVQSKDDVHGVIYLAGATSTTGGPVTWRPAKIAAHDQALGARIILISGKSAARVGSGIITAISPLSAGIKDTSLIIETDLAKDGILKGSPIIDTDGSVVGISTLASRATDESGFISGISLRLETKENAPVTQ